MSRRPSDAARAGRFHELLPDRTAAGAADVLRGITDLAAVKPADLRAFLAAEATHRPAVSSQSRTLAALKGFFRFLVENESLVRDPAAVLRTPKKREALPDLLDKRELARLLRSVAREDVWQRVHPGKFERDRLLLARGTGPLLPRSARGSQRCGCLLADASCAKCRSVSANMRLTMSLVRGVFSRPSQVISNASVQVNWHRVGPTASTR
jgi:hypothetical protein